MIFRVKYQVNVSFFCVNVGDKFSNWRRHLKKLYADKKKNRRANA